MAKRSRIPAVKLLDHFELRYGLSIDESKRDSANSETDSANDDGGQVNGATKKEEESSTNDAAAANNDASQVNDTNANPKDSDCSIDGTTVMISSLKLTDYR